MFTVVYPDARQRPQGQVLCVMTHANVLYSNFKYSNVYQITIQLYISTTTLKKSSEKKYLDFKDNLTFGKVKDDLTFGKVF